MKAELIRAIYKTCAPEEFGKRVIGQLQDEEDKGVKHLYLILELTCIDNFWPGSALAYAKGLPDVEKLFVRKLVLTRYFVMIPERHSPLTYIEQMLTIIEDLGEKDVATLRDPLENILKVAIVHGFIAQSQSIVKVLKRELSSDELAKLFLNSITTELSPSARELLENSSNKQASEMLTYSCTHPSLQRKDLKCEGVRILDLIDLFPASCNAEREKCVLKHIDWLLSNSKYEWAIGAAKKLSVLERKEAFERILIHLTEQPQDNLDGFTGEIEVLLGEIYGDEKEKST